MDSTSVILSGISIAFTAVMGLFIKRHNDTNDKLIKQHDTLWDAHNIKLEDSNDIKRFKEKFDDHEKEFLKFKITTELQNKHIIDSLDSIKRENEHIYANTKQWYSNVYHLIKGERPNL